MSAENDVRVGVIGCGAMARREHVPALVSAGARVTAFASRSRSSAEVAATQAGSGAVCGDWRELLDRDDVDAVVVATPNAQHAEQALAAIDAGKHVLVEKPFTVTVEEADRVIAAAARRRVVVMSGHNARFAPPLVAVRSLLATGGLGAITSVRAVFCHAGPNAWSPDARWFLDPTLAGGGALLDLGVHLADALRCLLEDDFGTVSAVLASPEGGVEHDAIVAFETCKGVVGSLQAGWRTPAGQDFSITMAADRATVVASAAGVRVLNADGRTTDLPLSAPTDSLQAAFLRAVSQGTAEHPDAEDGRAAVAFVQACYRAAATGRRVEVER